MCGADARSWSGFVARYASCGWSETFSQKLRSLASARSARYRPSLPVMSTTSPAPGCHHGARGLLRLARRPCIRPCVE